MLNLFYINSNSFFVTTSKAPVATSVALVTDGSFHVIPLSWSLEFSCAVSHVRSPVAEGLVGDSDGTSDMKRMCKALLASCYYY